MGKGLVGRSEEEDEGVGKSGAPGKIIVAAGEYDELDVVGFGEEDVAEITRS